MPCFRGVEVSVVTEAESRALPEFPHPDGSSIRLLSASLRATPSPQLSAAPSIHSETDSSRLQKVNPSISVYIPSIAGAQFWLQYKIERIPEPTRILYFKMFMNSRNVTNWGVDLKEQTSGTVVRALYEPCDRWHYRENGTLQRREGIESRTFHFAHNGENRSVADDGGLIEVQVFRARSKRSRATRLDPFREQDRYGISSPSGGLLENPEEAVYFEFHLIDPRDSPFASFRFHYRSWKNLTSLNLVAPVDIKGHAALLKSLCLDSGDADSLERDQLDEDHHRESDHRRIRASAQFEFGFEPKFKLQAPPKDRKRSQLAVKDNAEDEDEAPQQVPETGPPHKENTRPRTTFDRGDIFPPRTSSKMAPFPRQESAMPKPLCINKSPPKNRLKSPPQLFSRPDGHRRLLPQPSKILRDRIPEKVDGDLHRLSDTSTRSNESLRAPSLAPSLLRSVDSEEYDDFYEDEEEEVEYAIATTVNLPRETSQSRFIDVSARNNNNNVPPPQTTGSDSPSDYERSPASSDTSSASAAAGYHQYRYTPNNEEALAQTFAMFSPAPRSDEMLSLQSDSRMSLLELAEEPEHESPAPPSPRLPRLVATAAGGQSRQRGQSISAGGHYRPRVDSSQVFGSDDFF